MTRATDFDLGTTTDSHHKWAFDWHTYLHLTKKICYPCLFFWMNFNNFCQSLVLAMLESTNLGYTLRPPPVHHCAVWVKNFQVPENPFVASLETYCIYWCLRILKTRKTNLLGSPQVLQLQPFQYNFFQKRVFALRSCFFKLLYFQEHLKLN